MTPHIDIKRNLLKLDCVLRDVLEVLNKGVFGVVFLVDENGVMRGLFTDGDVRRALLSGATLATPAASCMNTRFTAGSSLRSHQENLVLLSEKVRHVPILDPEGRPVDMISWAELWRLPVMEPSLAGNELKYVSDCIATNWISSQGKYVNSFETAFADYIGIKSARCVSSGTTALHLALVALGIGPGDEVIVPDLTFAASANTVIHCGATPVLVDVTRETWTIDPAEIEAAITPRTKAIMPVHLYGHACDMDAIMALARKHNLFVVEDCAEALGAEYRGRKVGSIGDIGCFSFFANKVITTGEGGMVTTNDDALTEKMEILRSHGMPKGRRYWHTVVGYNYRMTNLQAAVGLAQIERIGDFLKFRESTAERYEQGLAGIAGLSLPPAEAWAKNIYWLYSILIDEAAAGISRDDLASKLATRGIETRPLFYPMHVMPLYAGFAKKALPVSQWLSERGLSLPTANDIRLEDVDRVCAGIRDIIAHGQFVKTHPESAGMFSAAEI